MCISFLTIVSIRAIMVSMLTNRKEKAMGKEPMSRIKLLVSRVEVYLRQMECKHDITHLSGPQGFTTMYLYKHQGQEVFIKDIERELQISKSVASNLIHRMEKNGFISVIPSQVDKRYKQLVLTEKGLEKAAVLGNFFEEVRGQLLDGVDKDDLDAVQRVINQIHINLDKKE